MKRLLILAAIFISAAATSQTTQWSGNYDVSKYFAQDTSTFFFGAAKGTKQVTIDFTDFDDDDAVLKIGTASADIQGWCGLKFLDSTGTEVDSVILNPTTYIQTTKNAHTGTRSTVSRIYALYPDGLYSDYIAITITWNSVESGRLKIRLEPQK